MKILMIYIFLLIYISFGLYGQGCSDAGVCSLGSLKNSESKTENFIITLKPAFSLGNNLTFIQTTYLDAELFYSIQSYFQIKWQYSFISGNLANVTGIGDIIFGFNQNIFNDSVIKFDVAVAFRLATNKANKAIDGRPLPMVYQTSNGTNDLLLGVSLLKDVWHLAIGYQHPFAKNENRFNKSAWEGNKDAAEYPESENLDRGDDIIIRLGRHFHTESFNFYISLLPIIRLEKSVLTINGSLKTVEESSGLTFNINASASFNISNFFDFGIDIGFPVYSIKEHPDGLLRTFVTALFIKYKI